MWEPQSHQHARFLGPLPLLREEDDDDDGEEEEVIVVETSEQLYSLVQPLFAVVLDSSSSMKICLHLHSTLQNALSPLHHTHTHTHPTAVCSLFLFLFLFSPKLTNPYESKYVHVHTKTYLYMYMSFPGKSFCLQRKQISRNPPAGKEGDVVLRLEKPLGDDGVVGEQGLDGGFIILPLLIT